MGRGLILGMAIIHIALKTGTDQFRRRDRKCGCRAPFQFYDICQSAEQEQGSAVAALAMHIGKQPQELRRCLTGMRPDGFP